jgi:hypothetical protein
MSCFSRVSFFNAQSREVLCGMGILAVFLVLASCATIKVESSYKNPDVVLFHASRVLVVGMTPDMKAREQFETKLREEFSKRGVEAVRSIDLFDVAFTTSERTEAELDRVEQQLLDKDFDAILFTKLVDVETRRSLGRNISEMGKTYDRFREDYLIHQGIYYNLDGTTPKEDYYAETSLYCICVGKERELIWRSEVRIQRTRNPDRVVRNYVKLLISSLESQQLIIGHPTF